MRKRGIYDVELFPIRIVEHPKRAEYVNHANGTSVFDRFGNLVGTFQTESAARGYVLSAYRKKLLEA